MGGAPGRTVPHIDPAACNARVMPTEAPLLEVRDLRIGFARQHAFRPNAGGAAGDAASGVDALAPEAAGIGAAAPAVDGVSFTVRRGKVLCLVGESGCGKSVTALSILRLLPSPPAVWLGGSVIFEGRDLAHLSENAFAAVRGNRIGMVFQDPMTSLNPVLRVGFQMTEGLRLHRGLSAREAERAAIDMLAKVGIADPAERARDFPHRMSGGMRQRVMIGAALACDPALIIADEPTTALDVTVQSRILSLMRRLIRESGAGLLLITHDLAVAAQTADEAAVMYAGRIVEQGSARAVLSAPRHPYTSGLLRSLPGMEGRLFDPKGANEMRGAGGMNPSESSDLPSQSGKTGESPRRARLGAIAGTVPGLWSRPSGCAFHPRCPRAFSRCRQEMPPLFPVPADATEETAHLCRCWLREEFID